MIGRIKRYFELQGYIDNIEADQKVLSNEMNEIDRKISIYSKSIGNVSLAYHPLYSSRILPYVVQKEILLKIEENLMRLHREYRDKIHSLIKKINVLHKYRMNIEGLGPMIHSVPIEPYEVEDIIADLILPEKWQEWKESENGFKAESDTYLIDIEWM
jgi:hypothetical protein